MCLIIKIKEKIFFKFIFTNVLIFCNSVTTIFVVLMLLMLAESFLRKFDTEFTCMLCEPVCKIQIPNLKLVPAIFYF